MLTIIIKVTNGCNLSCTYCSLGRKEKFEFITKEKLIGILRYSCLLAQNRNEKRLTFILHGGEPTLIDSNIYSYAIDRANVEFPEIVKNINIQTNGLKIDSDFINFIKKYDVSVGISLDGSQKIHNSQRKDCAGNTTYEKIIENIGILRKNDIQVSCLMVMTANAMKDDLSFLNYFANHKIHLKINPLLNYGEACKHPELFVKSGQYADYLIDIYKYVLKNSIDVSIAPIDKILQAILSKNRIRGCSFNPNCNKSFLCIDYNCDIYPCGKYSDMKYFKIGSIADGVNKINDSSVIHYLCERRTTKIPLQCKQCKFLNLCNAGCNAEANISNTFNQISILCEDYKKLFEYFSHDGLILYRDYLIAQKKVLESNAI